MQLAEQVGELARDVSETFERQSLVRTIQVETVLEVPFPLYVGDVKPDGISIVYAEDLDDATNTPGPYGLHWSWDNGYAVVKTVAGATLNRRYRLVFMIIGGA